MPGQLITRMAEAKLDVIGIDNILAEIAAGKSVKSIAKEINVSRQIIGNILNSDEYVERTKEARRQGAEALVDECLDIANEADPLTEKVAKLNISTRQWIASKYDKDRFGDTQNVVNISISSLHLDALRNQQHAPNGACIASAGDLTRARGALVLSTTCEQENK